MTQEEKQLLFKDLCARLPYGVKFHYNKYPQSNIDQDCDGTTIGYYCNLIVSANDKDFCVDRCKLYLRSMDDMTEEERHEYNTIAMHTIVTNKGFVHIEATDLIDWLNAHYFDYRGLIERGLAIKVTKENNPYK